MQPNEVHALAVNHGLTHEQAIIATAIAWAESGLRPDAVGDIDLQDDTWGPSVGLYQIRSLRSDAGTGLSRDVERLGDPSFNTRAMVEISNGGTNWQPWSVWKNGRYLAHVGAVRAAVTAGGAPMTPADIIRAAMADPVLHGIEIVYVDGWEGRGRPYAFDPQGCVIHHTATSRRAAGDYPSLGIVRDGRSDLPGPLSQFGLGRSGAVYVIAAGTANHAGPGGWRGLSGNTTVWGIEAENDGIGEPWSAEALDAYPRLVAALARHTPFGPEMVACHREWSEWKIDPTGIDGDEFRARVADLLAGPTTQPQEDVTMFIFDAPPERGGGVWQSDGVFRKPVRTGDTWPNVEGNAALSRPAVAKHLGVASVGLFDDLIDIEARLADLRPTSVGPVDGLDPQAVADLVVAKLGGGLAAKVADLLHDRLAG